ncbi:MULTISPECIES: WxL domain-containing protein [Furfurilactobacillus]|uniref:WxL domain-containing protein n=1 Tax=Furfurilactobacillus milii TaxID=2888272 RepID=A0ABT6DCC8_9LACO|nr:WxL domain-containing protein [Furfurilactobacillus milii]QLE65507.1 extracellular protein [Furfurilactobacillus rossiae]MCF6161223.1 WxL domain-containing protein [Furfurilactobacillus milii]MCF6163522.1 WxL domain-containing protein [Furfurilactobacillus milii]MDF9913809.1 WxL domain-containing protein [Furfurilactobacillus milii]QLE67937.1 extracellular protein [Furfurilactobacillus rossiae]
MFKKTQLFGVIAAFGLLIGPAMSVKAAGDVGSATTQVTAGFIAGEGPTGPVDPGNPGGGPIDDPEHPGTGATGPLRLNYVSKLISFGTQPIQSATTKRMGTTGSDVIGTYQSAQVSDERGTNAGWALKVSGTPLMSGTDTLEGATLKLPAGEVVTESGIDNGAVASEVSNALGVGGTLLSAPATKGGGLTVDRWTPAQTELTIIGGTAEAKDYTTNLTWTLQDSPAS